jgi:hypothetical protein
VRCEPVVLLAFVEHILKKANADDDESDTDVVDTESGAGKVFERGSWSDEFALWLCDGAPGLTIRNRFSLAGPAFAPPVDHPFDYSL